MNRLIVLIICFGFFSCSKKIVKPGFIKFKVENDSIYVISKNNYVCPLYIKVVNKRNEDYNITQLKAKDEAIVLRLSNQKTDTLSILKKYRFLGYYGTYNTKGYDTNYNYKLPFLKGYTSKIIQGYDGSFSHEGAFSAKTIDFDMKVGDTITAARDGIVVKVSQNNYKQGTTSKYKDYGNFVMIYHKDNTFSQYVHLKQYGSLVKVGDSVKANQPIALSGFTGLTTIPHLHFGVYKPAENGLESIPILIDSIAAKTLKRGDKIQKK